MKCRFCKDKATKSIDITYHPPQALVESLGTVFNKMVMGDVDDKDGRIKVELKSNKPLVIDETVEFIDDPEVFYREEKPGDEKMAEIFVCEDHHRLWELLYGGEVEEWGRKLEELKPEEREELEEATQKVWDEIEQIKERIRKKEKKGKRNDE